MPGPIVIGGITDVTTADLLANSRLQNAPSDGIMTFEFLSKDSTGTNRFLVSLQMPNGDTPLNQVQIPGSNPALAGVIDDRQKLMISRPVTQGGHVVVGLTETGTTTTTYRITFTPVV